MLSRKVDEFQPLPGGVRSGRRGAAQLSRAVQVDPIKPTLKAPGTKHLKLQYYELLSSVASKINLRLYHSDIRRLIDLKNSTESAFEELSKYTAAKRAAHKTKKLAQREEAVGRGLHSFSSQLNLSDFCGIGGAHSDCFTGGIRGCAGCVFCQKRLRLS